ncbi:MAG: hypothetical protein CVV21_00905 [Candidatus Goldiibacteriota bacterium HGW-Goldbacteria-1]|jgi:hypothetical protein|nr:MAG: hypothetical protein CVV21_00905 [Candidatus Goldiibacteriota bacterium HGW-Goldbacteria-1]
MKSNFIKCKVNIRFSGFVKVFVVIICFVLISIGCSRHISPEPITEGLINLTPTPLPDIFVIDDFEDNNLMTNITADSLNTWTATERTGVKLINIFDGAIYGSYALNTTATVRASDYISGINNSVIWGHRGYCTTTYVRTTSTIKGDDNGLDIRTYNSLSFALAVKVTPLASVSNFKFSVVLYKYIYDYNVMTSSTMYTIHADYVPVDLNGTWGIVTIPLSDFRNDLGETLSNNLVFEEMSVMTWSYQYEAPMQGMSVWLDFKMDDVKFIR